MKRASVSEAKNGLSGLLSDVRRGESVLITHRGEPVARLEPCHVSELMDEAAAELVRRGVASPPRRRLDVERLLAAPVPRLPKGVSASQIIVAERREGR